MAKSKLHPDIAATKTAGPKADAAVKRLVSRCAELANAPKLAREDVQFLVDVVDHVPPVRPHAAETLVTHNV